MSPGRTLLAYRVGGGCSFLIPEEECRVLHDRFPVPFNRDGRPFSNLEDAYERNRGPTVTCGVRECVWRKSHDRGDVVRDLTFTDGLEYTCLSKAWMVTDLVDFHGSPAPDVVGPLVVVQDRGKGNDILLLLPEAEARQYDESFCWEDVADSSRGGYFSEEYVAKTPGWELCMRRDITPGTEDAPFLKCRTSSNSPTPTALS